MQTRIEIRPAGRRDVDRILEIEAASFGRDAWDRSLFTEALEACPGLFVVAIVERNIAGYSITCIARNRAELVSIAVFPTARRCGVGEAMIRSTLRKLKRRRVKAWALMVRVGNRKALRFYDSLGFARLGRVANYYGRGRDAWRMEMRLS